MNVCLLLKTEYRTTFHTRLSYYQQFLAVKHYLTLMITDAFYY